LAWQVMMAGLLMALAISASSLPLPAGHISAAGLSNDRACQPNLSASAPCLPCSRRGLRGAVQVLTVLAISATSLPLPAGHQTAGRQGAELIRPCPYTQCLKPCKC
jgi:hypothetical protein